MSLISVAVALVYAALALLLALCVGTSAMAWQLKSRFPDEWARWGQPNEWLWLNRSAPGRHVFQFLQERAYRRTGQRWFVCWGELLRSGWYAGLVSLPLATGMLAAALLARD